MEKNISTVILIIGFVRLESTMKILDICTKHSSLPIIVSLDGPRNDDDALIIEKIQKSTLSHECTNRLTLKMSQQNMGLSEHVTKAINYSLNHYDSVIVLEDDCIPSGTFFNYCARALRHYKNRDDIIYISGSNLDVVLPLEKGEDCILTHYGQIWGWATWKDRWESRKTKVNLGVICRAQIPWREKIFWIRNFRKPLWDSIWGFYNLLSQKGYAVIPKLNLVSNIGFDGHATNYGEDSQRNLTYSLSEEDLDPRKCANYNFFVDRKIFNERYQGL